jgi:hypothetical protein
MGSNTYAMPKEEAESKFEEWLPFMAANSPIVYNMLKKHGFAGHPALDISIEALRELCVALFRDHSRLLSRVCDLEMKKPVLFKLGEE